MLALLKQMAYFIVMLASNQTIKDNGTTQVGTPYQVYNNPFLSVVFSTREKETECERAFNRVCTCNGRETPPPQPFTVTVSPSDLQRTSTPPVDWCVTQLKSGLISSNRGLQEELQSAYKGLPTAYRNSLWEKFNRSFNCRNDRSARMATTRDFARLRSCQKLICKSNGLQFCSSCELPPDEKNCTSLSQINVTKSIVDATCQLRGCFVDGSSSDSTTQMQSPSLRNRRKTGKKAKRRQQRKRKNCVSVKSLKTQFRRMRKSREASHDVKIKNYYVSKSIAVRNRIDSCLCFISQRYSNI